ncbi:helix-turn-helix domain-containing protein [Haloferax sp. KTX1]|uniref:helix-turn-helix domain-containing protein n=1 Tax=Haloferax sp. KTX1 TaxID=2600597 RepID=UPI0011DCEB00|nr:helix-turn-helix domain-containing protein [Haloferax sp. KTX1]
MAIVSEILLRSELLPLVGVARSLPTREISLSQLIRLDDARFLLMVSVEPEAKAAFEAEVDAQPEVADVRPVGETPKGWFYQVVTQRTTDQLESHDPSEFEGVLMEATVTGEGWVERKIFADYEALSTLRDRCQAYGLPFELLNISSDPERPDKQAQFGLTDRQYEAMSLAFSRGYYDTPRSASTADVARELDISAPALSDLLRRAEHRLISQTIANGSVLNPITSR